jgi:hypothetical protein
MDTNRTKRMRRDTGKVKSTDQATGQNSTPTCVQCESNLTGSRQSQECPECGWQIDWDAACDPRVHASLSSRIAMPVLLACGIGFFHFLLTYGFLSVVAMAAFARPPQGRWEQAVDTFTGEAIRILYLPMWLHGPSGTTMGMIMSRLLINSVIWGATLAAVLIGLYELRKRLKTRHR